jgi:competence protein ComFC
MLLDILFPRICVGCGKLGKYICSKCKKNIYELNIDTCPICERESFLGFRHKNCVGDLDGNYSLFYYKGITKKIITSIKYKLLYSVWNEFKDLISESKIQKLKILKNHFGNCRTQVIPLHESRYKLRGFNQSTLLQSYISKKLDITAISFIKRIKKTEAQVKTFSKQNRRDNIFGAFTINKNIEPPQSIILIDDVYTTGSTCKEAARTLKLSGVQKVYSITIAKD